MKSSTHSIDASFSDQTSATFTARFELYVLTPERDLHTHSGRFLPSHGPESARAFSPNFLLILSKHDSIGKSP